MWLTKSTEIKKHISDILAEDSKWAKGTFGGAVKSATLRVLNIGIGQAVPFASRNKFEVLELKRGSIKAKIAIKGNKNHFGGMYAGAIFTVAEIPGGVIAILNFDSKFYPILKDLKVEFIKVAKTDVTVSFEITDQEMKRIQSDAEKNGKTDFELVGEVVDSNGVLVAKTYGTYQLRSKS